MATDDPVQHRRADDILTPTRIVVDRTLATAVLAGSIGFLYQLSEILQKHVSWDEFRMPAAVGELVFAMVCGLIAIGAALGLNFTSLLKGFRPDNGTR